MSTSEEKQVNICTSRDFPHAFEPIQVTAPLTLMFANIWMINATLWFYPTMCLLPPEKTHTTGRQPFGWNPYGFMPGLCGSLAIAIYLLNHPLLLPLLLRVFNWNHHHHHHHHLLVQQGSPLHHDATCAFLNFCRDAPRLFPQLVR